MFGAKKKLQSESQININHPEIRIRAGNLITTANRAEATSAKNGEPDLTHAGEVVAARELVGAQQQLTRSVDLALVRGASIEDIQTRIFDPMIETSVVSDLAWMMLRDVLAAAKKQIDRRIWKLRIANL